MSRHHLAAILAALGLAVSACSRGGGAEGAGAATIPTDQRASTTTEPERNSPVEPAPTADEDASAWREDPVAVAIEFVEQSEPVAVADPEELEDRLGSFVHPSARERVIGQVRKSTTDNQELGLVRWRHAVVEASWTDLADGDVQVELWQAAVLTVDPDEGPALTATVWATDILTLTETADGWQIIDRIVRAGPTPPLAASTIGDDASLIEDRLVGFDDAHDLLTHNRVRIGR